MCSSGAGAKYVLFPLGKNKSIKGQEKALFFTIMIKIGGGKWQILDTVSNMTSCLNYLHV